MRLNALCLISVLTIAAAAPFSAGAVPAGGDLGAAAGARQVTPVADGCGPGWYWEQAGYAKHGKWRPAHCARR